MQTVSLLSAKAMRIAALFALSFCLLVGSGTSRLHAQQGSLADQIKLRLSQFSKPGGNVIGGKAIAAAEFVSALYRERSFRAAWRDPTNFMALVREVRESRNDGLIVDDFHARALGFGRLDFWPPAMTAAERDILKTSSLINLLYQLYFGKVSPERIDPNWNLERQAPLPMENAVRTISIALETNDLASLIALARGDDPGYLKLRETLKTYRGILERGGWPSVSAGAVLKPGMTDARVPVIRRRLAATADLGNESDASSNVYDPGLVEAVKAFQKRHGIDIDGIIGPAVTRALNVSAEQRVDQIRVNLERARWGARSLRRQKDLVVVNIAGFYLLTVLDGQFAWTTEVITGRPYHKTPVFTDRIRYIEFNPTWTIPPGILRNEILPKLRNDPGYLTAKGYDLVAGNGAKVNPASVNWQTTGARGFPYRVVQPPGPKNALGLVKFMFPNKYNVYLHDTPSRQLFGKTGRAFSHGCVRVKDPMKFAELLLGYRNRMTRQQIDQTVASGRRTRVNLSKPIPVAIMYWTVDPLWQDGIRFYEDVYRRDGKVLKALNAKFRPAAR
ncbi:MAG: L,D-transpeptidase family protein [Hyphomicrobiaceae bacterium]